MAGKRTRSRNAPSSSSSKRTNRSSRKQEEREEVLSDVVNGDSSSCCGNEEEPTSCSSFQLECLNDDILLEIASFLILVCPKINTNSDNNPIHVNDARLCWSFYGSLSKDFRARTRVMFDHDVEADFYDVNLRNYYSTFLFLTNNKIRLTKLRIYTESYSTNYVAMLCQMCDTSKLESVEVKVSQERFSRFTTAGQIIYSLSEIDDRVYEIDDGPVATNVAATESGSSREARPMSMHELNEEIGTHCPSLRKLKINAWAQDSQLRGLSTEEHDAMSHKNVDRGGVLSRKLRNLRRLEISVCGRSMEGVKLLRAFLRLAEKIKGLETLVLSSGDHMQSKYWTHGEKREERVRIQSKSLRVIDVTGCAKGLWITKCYCPSLERFVCTGGYYGNGVRECKPEELYERTTDGGASGTFQAGSTKFYGLRVPDSCIVDLR